VVLARLETRIAALRHPIGIIISTPDLWYEILVGCDSIYHSLYLRSLSLPNVSVERRFGSLNYALQLLLRNLPRG